MNDSLFFPPNHQNLLFFHHFHFLKVSNLVIVHAAYFVTLPKDVSMFLLTAVAASKYFPLICWETLSAKQYVWI